MPEGVGDIINSVSDVFGFGPASKQSQAVQSAADTGAASARYAADLQKQMFEKQIELQEPFRQAGLSGQNRLLELLGIGGTAGAQGYGKYASAEFTPANFLANQDPGYAFRMAEGMKALERSAAARGGLLSGATLKGTQRYGQDLASQEYQNAFNRYQTQRANTLNPYASLAGVAQSSANTLGQAAGAYGANAGNIAMMGGANAANAQLALGNIRGQQFSNAANALGQGYNFYKRGGFSDLFGSSGGSGFTDIGGEGAAANRALAEYM
jgi:hypothetical protein